MHTSTVQNNTAAGRDASQSIFGPTIHSKSVQFLPAHFCRLSQDFEDRVRNTAKTLCEDYVTGTWRYFALSNGGFFIAPADLTPLHVRVKRNRYSHTMSADAAGLVFCIETLGTLVRETQNDILEAYFYAVRDFANQHCEARSIFEAVYRPL